MLSIKIAKWYNNADSPVIFMIDDFCNKWVDLNRNGKVDLGEDWGYAKDRTNSSFNFLRTTFLGKYPYLKVTFFTPVGKRSPVIKQPMCEVYSAPINNNEETKEFFRRIYSDERFEIAYHGLTHGIPGKTVLEFRQEWEIFRSVEEAVEQIEQGKEIYFNTLGEYPKGGKYCGYEYNDFADESINQTGFLWWCRDWNRGQENISDEIRFEPKYFGANRIIDIPSSIEGNLCTVRKGGNTIKQFAKVVLKSVLCKKKLKLINDLLRKRMIISIQVHIAPSRVDRIRQTPNLFEDRESLFAIFDFLKDKNVWYATGTEVAEYFDTRENTKILKVNKDCFQVKYNGRLLNSVLTIIIKINKISRKEQIEVIAPDGEIYKSFAFCDSGYRVNLEISNGIYRINE